MCTHPITHKGVTGATKRRPRLHRAERLLAQHIAEGLGVTVEPERLRAWLVENWHTVQRLAHAIHDSGRAL